MQAPDPPSGPSPKRRFILAGIGAGIGATMAAIFWRRPSGFVPYKTPGKLDVPRHAAVPQPEMPMGSRSGDYLPGAPMTREWFLPHLNSEFQMSAEILSVTPVKLIEVSPAMALQDKDHHVSYTAFSLVFKGPQYMRQESGVFHLRHPELGKMDVFLSPVGRYKDQVRYEAVFSRRI